jgi:hypothetical protein
VVPRYGWPLRALAVATVLSYVVAGVTKLRRAGLGWFDSDNLRNWVAYDLVRKELFGDPYLQLTVPLLRYAWLFAPIAVVTVLLEVGAPVALAGRRAAIIWSFAAWLFHLSVLALMSVAFPYQLLGIAYLPVVLSASRHVLTDRARWSDRCGVAAAGARRLASADRHCRATTTHAPIPSSCSGRSCVHRHPLDAARSAEPQPSPNGDRCPSSPPTTSAHPREPCGP